MSDRITDTVDADGVWRVKTFANGVVSRVLIEPSPAALARIEAENEAAEQAELDRQAALETKKEAIRRATTIAALRAAVIDYLGIGG